MNYKSICDKAQVGLYMLHDGMLFYVNPYMCSVLGYDQTKSLIGKAFRDFVHPGDRDRYRLVMPHDRPPNMIGEHVFRMLRKNGDFVWVRADGKTVRIRGKDYHVGHLNDITGFMGRERNYRESLERYQKIFDEIEDSLAQTDLKGNIVFSNRGAARIWAGNTETNTGDNFRSHMDEETAKVIFQEYNRIYKTGRSGKFSYEITRKDGIRRVLEDSVSLIRNRQEEITGFWVATRDITQRREEARELAEHRSRLEAIFRSVNDAIITVDPELNVIEANKATERLCSVSVRDMIGKTLITCIDHCSRACVEVLKQTLEKKVAINEYRAECGHRKRRHQLVSMNSSPLLDPEGKFMGAVLVIRDITLLNDLEKELWERHQFQNIIGKSKRMQDIYSLLENLANFETTVLLTGESGTGKDMMAKALHYSGERAFKPFVTVNCSALTENLLESELFGHVKGAFTGAIKDKQGRFELAEGGTILLDEIGDISPMIQSKLLRVLQDKEFERVGESLPQKADVRVVASTNKDLKQKVKRGEFREDLYYRLKVMEIHLPPLRERLEDVPLLVDHFCSHFNEQFNKKIGGTSDEVLSQFMLYPWPGNVRELKHAMEHAFVLCPGSLIMLDHLPPEIRGIQYHKKDHHRQRTDNIEEILQALNKTHWNKTKAAQLLGITRRTLHRKINLYRIADE